MHEGNTLLPKDEVEMLTVLRINRGWMEYMRAHHAEEAKAQAKQPFNKTVVDDADDAAAGPSAAPSAAAPAPAADAGPSSAGESADASAEVVEL